MPLRRKLQEHVSGSWWRVVVLCNSLVFWWLELKRKVSCHFLIL
jgi:hypothetical protein